jgi:tetratricopeptide (TPR) repeat protein
VYYTDRLWPTSIPEDDRHWIAPDVKAGYSQMDFFEGNDPVLEAAEQYRATPVNDERIDPEAARKIVGRYLFSPYQILGIEFDAENGALSFALTDFIESSFFAVRSAMHPITPHRFRTDVEGLTIDAAQLRGESVEQLFIDWKGHAKTIARAPEGFRLPVELIHDGRIEAGVAALLADKESRSYYRMTVGWFLDETGHRLLGTDRVDEAILLFRANTEFYPKDIDTWNSLGKGYLAAGDLRRTEQCYEKILELDPDNEAAAAILERLERNGSR